MNYESVFHLLKDISKKENIPLILIGGFAVNHYKYVRQSIDVDFLITEQDFQKILAPLESAGYKIDYQQKVFARLISNKGLLMMDIDFMFVDKQTFDKITADSQRVDIAGCAFRVPSLWHLIALKLHAVKYNTRLRWAKDIGDIASLMKINHLNIRGPEFKELCLKYATEEIYDKILDGI